MIDITAVRERFLALSAHLDEPGRRIFAATEARTAGYGGIAAVSQATRIAASTIGRGLAELSATAQLAPARVRRPGGGEKSLVDKDPTLWTDLLAMVEPEARGDPMSPPRWTCNSLSQLARALVAMGHKIGRSTVGELLHRQKFSLQANCKTCEGESHPDRNAQFVHLNESVREALADGEPVISVDTKKKELVGDFKNAGRAAPYGVYDLAANAGWVGVGMNNDTSSRALRVDATFAVQTIRRWWQEIGRERYTCATRLTITADGGGSNGSRLRLWKIELQRLATELGIDIVVHHLPPGTSKWNKIEHRLFSFITMNWKATPLVSYRVIVNLIAATKTATGLTLRCELDSTHYPKAIVVSNQQMAALKITRNAFHGERNYTIQPTETIGYQIELLIVE